MSRPLSFSPQARGRLPAVFSWSSFALIAFLAGCSELPKRDPAKDGPFFTPSNVTHQGRLPIELRRVLTLPASGGPQMSEESLERIDRSIVEELTRTGRFEVAAITRDELHRLFGIRAISSIEPLPHDFFEKLAKLYAADGVLFTDVTVFSPYPPLNLGLRFKLGRLIDHQIVWAADNVFSAANPSVANAARRHALKLGADRGPGDLSHTILQNPARFAAYAAAASFDALPPR